MFHLVINISWLVPGVSNSKYCDSDPVDVVTTGIAQNDVTQTTMRLDTFSTVEDWDKLTLEAVSADAGCSATPTTTINAGDTFADLTGMQAGCLWNVSFIHKCGSGDKASATPTLKFFCTGRFNLFG